MSEGRETRKEHLSPALMRDRLKTMEEINFLMNYACQTVRSAVIPPGPNGNPAEVFSNSVEFGIVWVPDPQTKGRLSIKEPFDIIHDPNGTAYITQWEGPVGP